MTEKVLDRDNIDVVIYHHPCSDGFGSAFVVWYYYKMKFGLERATQIAYVPATFLPKDGSLSTEYIDKLIGKNILMCDFSYPFAELTKIINASKSFMILDHHKTAKADLNEVPASLKIFDMNRSGAGITWDYFNPDAAIPKFLAHIQDRDIWAHKLPNTNEFVAYFYDLEFDFNLWETYLLEENVAKAIEKGKSYLEYQNRLISKIISRMCYVIHEIDNKYVVGLYSNCPELQSDIGNKSFDKYPMGDFSAIWNFDMYKKRTTYSLRSTDDRYDVSIIAKKFGGGGHRNASGVSFDGCQPCLPSPDESRPDLPSYPIIEDFGLLTVLLRGTIGKIQVNKKEIGYTLFKVKEIKPEWLMDKYFELLKRKTSSTPYIIFQTPSEKINIDAGMTTITHLKDYTMIYNEMSIKKPEFKLQFMVNNSQDQAVVFSSELEFEDLFSEKSENVIEHDVSSDEISDGDSD